MYSHKPLAFPDAKKFSDLFEAVSPEKTLPGGSIEITDYNIRRGKIFKARIPVGPYCGVSGALGYHSLYVTPRPEVLERLQQSTIASARDSLTFKVVVRDDGTALITADNNLIIGGTWLALIPASEIPVTAEVES